MATIIQIRRDTASNWTTNNPTLAQGELGLETDTSKMKLGDGATAWNSLAYIIDNSQWNGKENLFRYETMPTASASYLGKIVEFIGTTDANYTNGYFYKCTVENDVYSWTRLSVQPETEVINNVTSTSTTSALSAKMGKELQDEVNNLKNIGRFLAIWNSATGLPLTNPTTMPYTYKTGDYYRVGAVASGSGTNYKPNGTSYDGTASTTAETESVEVGWVYYFDGTQWLAQSAGGAGTVQDVQVNGTSIVASGTGIANIQVASRDSVGVCSVKPEYGVGIGTAGGVLNVLYTNSATANDISRKTNQYKPITPTTIDLVVKTGITTNTNTLSDSEKTAAQTWLGVNTVSMNVEFSDGTSGTYKISE